MAFCKKCGQQIEDDAVFCPKCGANNGAAPKTVPQQPQMANSKQLHCPNCRSANLTPTTESSVTGAISKSYAGVSATSVSNIHRTYWMCGNCGNKFRSIPSLQEEIAKVKKETMVSIAAAIICGIIALILFSKIKENPVNIMFIGGLAVLAGAVAIVGFAYIFVYKSKEKKLTAELDYLNKNCF